MLWQFILLTYFFSSFFSSSCVALKYLPSLYLCKMEAMSAALQPQRGAMAADNPKSVGPSRLEQVFSRIIHITNAIYFSFKLQFFKFCSP